MNTHVIARGRQSPILTVLPFSLAICALSAVTRASELFMSRAALQGLMVSEGFKDHGRLYLTEGTCYAYLERPRVTLVAGRVVVDAHLSSRMGVEVGDGCVGTDLASDVRFSGRLVGSGSQVTLADIKMDRVKDEQTRQALQLLQSAAGVSLPKAVDIDLLPLLKPTIIPGTAAQVDVTDMQITGVTTQPEGIRVSFEMKLNAH